MPVYQITSLNEAHKYVTVFVNGSTKVRDGMAFRRESVRLLEQAKKTLEDMISSSDSEKRC